MNITQGLKENDRRGHLLPFIVLKAFMAYEKRSNKVLENIFEVDERFLGESVQNQI